MGNIEKYTHVAELLKDAGFSHYVTPCGMVNLKATADLKVLEWGDEGYDPCSEVKQRRLVNKHYFINEAPVSEAEFIQVRDLIVRHSQP